MEYSSEPGATVQAPEMCIRDRSQEAAKKQQKVNRKAAKKQRKMLRKAGKKQRKAMKQYQKAQRNSVGKVNRR